MKKYFKSFLLILSLITINNTYGSYIWEQKANFGGGLRDAAFGFAIGNFGYVGCGRTQTGVSNSVIKYDPATDSWTQVSNYPGQGRFGLFSMVIGNLAYIGTGWDASSAGCNDVYMFDPVSNIWTPKSNFPAAGLYTTASFVIGDTGYVGLGCCGNRDDFFRYVPAIDQWTPITSFPSARLGSIGFSINNKGYVGCGYTAGNHSQKDLYEYDPVADSWTLKSYLPALPRRAPVAFVINNSAFIGMGYNDSTYMTDFYQYNPTTNQWATIASIGGVPRYWGFSFVIGQYGYSGCGSYYNISSPQKVSDFWRLSLCDREPLGFESIPGAIDNFGMHARSDINQGIIVEYELGHDRNVMFQVFNSSGQIVLNSELPINTNSTIISHSLSSGIYIYVASNSEKIIGKGKLAINR
jgi:N-acetylneuraminic acid mutarotase